MGSRNKWTGIEKSKIYGFKQWSNKERNDFTPGEWSNRKKKCVKIHTLACPPLVCEMAIFFSFFSLQFCTIQKIY